MNSSGQLPKFVSLLMCCLFGGLGCANQTPSAALIQEPTGDTLQVLNQAASELLDGRKVTLAATAFTQSSKISLEPAIRNTPKGRLATGRIRTLPPELRLVRVGSRCELEHLESLKRAALPGVSCRLADPANL